MDGRSEERRTESGIELELVRDQRADGLSERFANVNKLVFLNVGVLNLSILDWESKQTREDLKAPRKVVVFGNALAVCSLAVCSGIGEISPKRAREEGCLCAL